MLLPEFQYREARTSMRERLVCFQKTVQRNSAKTRDSAKTWGRIAAWMQGEMAKVCVRAAKVGVYTSQRA